MTEPWPQSASAGITEFLRKLRSLGNPQGEDKDKPEKVGRGETPYSLQDLQSGASMLTKVWASLVGVVGGLPAAWALVRGILTSMTSGPSGGPVKITLIAAGAALLCVVALSIAFIVRGDVAARATVRAARHHAEGQIVSAALTNYNFSFPTGFIVHTSDNKYLPIKNFTRRSNGAVFITPTYGDALDPSEYDQIFPASEILNGLVKGP